MDQVVRQTAKDGEVFEEEILDLSITLTPSWFCRGICYSRKKAALKAANKVLSEVVKEYEADNCNWFN